VLFDADRPVEQLHWGGGTPTFISDGQMRELMRETGRHFRLLDDDRGEYSIEIDPREATAETVKLLREIGFNRMSLGVQDFDDRVQRAVNRLQSERETVAVLEAARAEGFRSVSVDLIYGLPHQSVASFAGTLDRVIGFGPDRLSVFNYAHLPELFKPQRRIAAEDLPAPEEKLEILQMCGERLARAGYVYIGMDHFAKPDDELAVAQRDGTLYRNFQGYSTHAHCDLIGLGITSIGMVGPTYSQNVRTLEEYYERIDAGRLPVFRGLELSLDDQIRRDIITGLICHFTLDFAAVESAWDIDFAAYFRDEWPRLEAMARDGLIALDDRGIVVSPGGRLLIRNLCMVFDAYLKPAEERRHFSRVI
jgi:oxygen-independent coproporphyrinogen-3 oxidase